MARNLRSPETKAHDTLALAERKIARIDARLHKAMEAVQAIRAERVAAVVVCNYAAANPALHMDPLVGYTYDDEVTLGGDGVLVAAVLGDQAESAEPDTADEIRAQRRGTKASK